MAQEPTLQSFMAVAGGGDSSHDGGYFFIMLSPSMSKIFRMIQNQQERKKIFCKNEG